MRLMIKTLVKTIKLIIDETLFMMKTVKNTSV